MTYEEAAMAALVQGVKDGRKVALREAPYIKDTLGFNPDTYTLENMKIEVGRLPKNVLGVTSINDEGKAVAMRISSSIPKMAMDAARLYNKSDSWALGLTYMQARHTTEHEGYHVFSAPMSRGEKVDDSARDVMESVTTRGRYVMKKKLGQHKDAEFVKATNPYPGAWAMSAVADWAPYKGLSSSSGYAGFLDDASQFKFYKPLGWLAKSAAKAAFTKGRDAMRDIGTSRYVPQAA